MQICNIDERGTEGARQRPMSMDRAAVQARWLTLTRDVLPALATERAWPVSADHCFQRILLDHVCGGCWYDHVAGRPAYRHLDEDRLRRAVATAEAIVAGTADPDQLNRESLAFRKNR